MSSYFISWIMLYFNQVWLFLALSLVAMTLTLTFFMWFYRKYMEKSTQFQYNNNPGGSVVINHHLIDFSSFGRNAIFVWSHLTNHCKSIVYRSFALQYFSCVLIFCQLTFLLFFLVRLLYTFKLAPRFAACRWHLVSYDGCFGQCLRG